MLFASEILRERSLAECTPIDLIWERAKNLLSAFAVRLEADWTDCQSVQKIFLETARLIHPDQNSAENYYRSSEAFINLLEARQVLGCAKKNRF